MLRELLYVRCDKCAKEVLLYDNLESTTYTFLYPIPDWTVCGDDGELDTCPVCKEAKA